MPFYFERQKRRCTVSEKKQLMNVFIYQHTTLITCHDAVSEQSQKTPLLDASKMQPIRRDHRSVKKLNQFTSVNRHQQALSMVHDQKCSI